MLHFLPSRRNTAADADRSLTSPASLRSPSIVTCPAFVPPSFSAAVSHPPHPSLTCLPLVSAPFRSVSLYYLKFIRQGPSLPPASLSPPSRRNTSKPSPLHRSEPLARLCLLPPRLSPLVCEAHVPGSNRRPSRRNAPPPATPLDLTLSTFQQSDKFSHSGVDRLPIICSITTRQGSTLPAQCRTSRIVQRKRIMPLSVAVPCCQGQKLWHEHETPSRWDLWLCALLGPTVGKYDHLVFTPAQIAARLSYAHTILDLAVTGF